MGEAPDEGVVHEGIRLVVVEEEAHGVVEIAIGGGGTEGKNSADGDVVSGQASLDELGVEPVEVPHAVAFGLEH